MHCYMSDSTFVGARTPVQRPVFLCDPLIGGIDSAKFRDAFASSRKPISICGVHRMAFGMVVKVRVESDRESDFRSAISELAAHVAATEPGTRLYLPLQVRHEPGAYVVIELYESEADHDRHLENVRALPLFSQLNELIAERSNVLSLDPIGPVLTLGELRK